MVNQYNLFYLKIQVGYLLADTTLNKLTTTTKTTNVQFQNAWFTLHLLTYKL